MSAPRVLPPDDFFKLDEQPAAEMPEEAPSAKRLKTNAMTIEEFASRPLPTKRLFGDAKVKAEMEAMAASGEWDGASGHHFVALYEFLHRTVYGVEADIDRKSRAFANAAAGRMLAKDFDGDATKAMLFVKWVWRREESREEWRRANRRDGQRIGWRLQFCFGSLVADYRVHCARQSG